MRATISGVRDHLKRFFTKGLRDLWVRPPGNVAALDGARSIAVLLVICDHFAYYWKELGNPHLAITSLPIFVWGWTGVDLFFVLSGLLIGQQLWKEYGSTSSVDFFRFFLARAFRIWPLYFATLLLLVILPLSFKPRWPDFIFISNYVHVGGYIRGWSLSAEEQFYLLTPLLFVILRRRGETWIVAALGVSISAVLLSRYITSRSLMAQAFDISVIKEMMYFPFHLHCEGLITGLLLAFFTVRHQHRLGGRIHQGVAYKAAVFGILLAMSGLLLRYLDGLVFNFLALAFVYTGFIAWLLVDQSKLSSPFRAHVFFPLSRLSFGMYLNHFLIPGTADYLIRTARAMTESEYLIFLFALLGSIAQSAFLAVITFLLIERPGLLARAKFLQWYQLKFSSHLREQA